MQFMITWRDALDIGLVAGIIYGVISLVKGTRAVSVIYGLLLVVAVYYLSEEMGLYTLNWLLANFLGSFFLLVIILFQPDIRKALSHVGQGRLWSRKGMMEEEVVAQIITAVLSMARRRVGALVVIERKVPLGDLVERGVRIGARVSKDLLLTLFYPNTPLHDGAVIVRGNEILAAGCILPLYVGLTESSELGTRHRAAIGVTEESDAVAVVVSEERGDVSVAINGKLTTALDEMRLVRVLKKAMQR